MSITLESASKRFDCLVPCRTLVENLKLGTTYFDERDSSLPKCYIRSPIRIYFRNAAHAVGSRMGCSSYSSHSIRIIKPLTPHQLVLPENTYRNHSITSTALIPKTPQKNTAVQVQIKLMCCSLLSKHSPSSCQGVSKLLLRLRRSSNSTNDITDVTDVSFKTLSWPLRMSAIYGDKLISTPLSVRVALGGLYRRSEEEEE